MSKEILYEDDNRMLIWDEDQKDLIWINDDTVNYIEPTESLFERFDTIQYFGKFLPLSAMSYIVRQLKGQN